jgi:hypothetical protein
MRLLYLSILLHLYILHIVVVVVVFVVVVVLSLNLLSYLLCIHCGRESFNVVFCVVYLIECVVTSCNVCYLSVVYLLYYCHRAKTHLQSNNKYINIH